MRYEKKFNQTDYPNNELEAMPALETPKELETILYWMNNIAEKLEVIKCDLCGINDYLHPEKEGSIDTRPDGGMEEGAISKIKGNLSYMDRLISGINLEVQKIKKL